MHQNYFSKMARKSVIMIHWFHLGLLIKDLQNLIFVYNWVNTYMYLCETHLNMDQMLWSLLYRLFVKNFKMVFPYEPVLVQNKKLHIILIAPSK